MGVSFPPLLPAVWSALCTVFTFFASFCSSASWNSFIPTACRVDTVGIRLRHPGDVRARVLRELPSGSVWHVDPPPPTPLSPWLHGNAQLGLCSWRYLSVCPIVSTHGNSKDRGNHSQPGRTVYDGVLRHDFHTFCHQCINLIFFYGRFKFDRKMWTSLRFHQFQEPNKLFLAKHRELLN